MHVERGHELRLPDDRLTILDLHVCGSSEVSGPVPEDCLQQYPGPLDLISQSVHAHFCMSSLLQLHASSAPHNAAASSMQRLHA